MATQLKLRRDTAANWTSVNPVLAQGEPGWETDTNCGKVGDGTLAWNALPYLWGDKSALASVRSLVPTAVANTGGTASVSGRTVTFAGVSSLSVSGVFGAVGSHMIDMILSGSATSALNLRLRAGSTDSTDNYVLQTMYASGSSVAGARTTATTAGITSVLSGSPTAAEVRLWQAGVAAATRMQVRSIEPTSTSTALIAGVIHATAAAYDGFTLSPASGTITGTLTVHGLGI